MNRACYKENLAKIRNKITTLVKNPHTQSSLNAFSSYADLSENKIGANEKIVKNKHLLTHSFLHKEAKL